MAVLDRPVAKPRPVYLNLQSADVCHSYWVPRLGGKTDVLPGRANTMWIQTNDISWSMV